MPLTARYPHVRELVLHYANQLSDDVVLSILDRGLVSESEAEHLSRFIWRMVDEMTSDREERSFLIGGTDNTAMAPDISYEMDVFMEESGFSSIWERVSDES